MFGFLDCYSTVFDPCWRWRAADRGKYTAVHRADTHTSVRKTHSVLVEMKLLGLTQWEWKIQPGLSLGPFGNYLIRLYFWFRFVTYSKNPCCKVFRVLLIKDMKGLVEHRNTVVFRPKREECDYREDTRLGRISESTADYCLNYTNIRTVFISAGLSFAWRAVLLVVHYVVRNHMFAHAHRQTHAYAGCNRKRSLSVGLMSHFVLPPYMILNSSHHLCEEM